MVLKNSNLLLITIFMIFPFVMDGQVCESKFIDKIERETQYYNKKHAHKINKEKIISDNVCPYRTYAYIYVGESCRCNLYCPVEEKDSISEQAKKEKEPGIELELEPYFIHKYGIDFLRNNFFCILQKKMRVKVKKFDDPKFEKAIASIQPDYIFDFVAYHSGTIFLIKDRKLIALTAEVKNGHYTGESYPTPFSDYLSSLEDEDIVYYLFCNKKYKPVYSD